MGKKKKTCIQRGGHLLRLKPEDGGGIIMVPTTDQVRAHFFELIDAPGNLESISLISDSSKYSFVFKIVFIEGVSRFLDNDMRHVRNFAIKIGFITNNALFRIDEIDGITAKYSTTKENFEHESSTLRKIWTTSKENNYKMVCPIYTCDKVGKRFTFGNLITRLMGTTDVEKYANYLNNWLRLDEGNFLGIIVMEEVENSVTLGGLYNISNRSEIIGSIWALVIFLALKHRIINIDLNLNNLLINRDTGKILVVDFGLSWFPGEKPEIQEAENEFNAFIFKYPSSKQIEVRDIFDIISRLAQIEIFLNEIKGFKDENSHTHSPLSFYLDEIKGIVGFDMGHPIFAQILEKYNALNEKTTVIDESLIHPLKRTKTSQFDNNEYGNYGGARTKRKRRTKRRRKSRRKRTYRRRR